MYVPKQFALEDVAECHGLMRRFPLGAVVTLGDGGLEASHIPFVLHAEFGAFGQLRGHVARPNRQWTRARGEALVIFHLTNGYVTPSLYPSKLEHGKVVPTWNYVSIHARGPVRFIEEGTWLAAHLEALTSQNETGREHPWALDDAPADYIAQLSRAIVGVEIDIVELTGAAKVIQHRPLPDRLSVHEALTTSAEKGDHLMANFLERSMANRSGNK